MTDLRAIGESVANAVVERVGRGIGHVQERKPLSYDLLESDDSYLVVFDAAGANKSDVQVRFVDTEVQVRIDRFREFHDGYEMRFPGRGLSLDGKAKLPDDATVDAEAATATVTKHGTLRVYIPKTEEGKDVAVEAEGEATGTDSEDAAGGETSVVEEQPTEKEAKEATTARSAEEDGERDGDEASDEDDASAEGTDATASTESMLDEEATIDDPDARVEPAEAAGQPTDESMDETDDEFVEQAESRDEDGSDEDDETRD